MKKMYLLLAFSMAIPQLFFGQFSFSDVEYWIGSGEDSTIFVVDFKDATWDSSYAFGYLHDGATGEQMLNDIAAADENFSVDISGGFLNDIEYGSHAGIGGDPNYWGTWSGTSLESLEMNSGLGTQLENGAWFGCSYTDFDPALAPGGPIPAFNPQELTTSDVTFWVGSGTDSTIFVCDFLVNGVASSYAWGYIHNGEATGADLLTAISDADPLLNVAMGGGFLNDITYGDLEGIGGDPNYWGTWSASNLGDWYTNSGIGTELGDGDYFGVSYTDFNPAVRPQYPQPAESTVGLGNVEERIVSVYPNPAVNTVSVEYDSQSAVARLFQANGKQVASWQLNSNNNRLDVSDLASGLYILQVNGSTTKLQIR